MFSKVLCIMAVASLAVASEHGAAYSSLHISRQDGKPELVQVGHGDGKDGHGDGKDGHGHGATYDYYAYPKYDFEYKIEDPHTGDIKSQHESRDGDVVKGYYSLHQPDGSERIVHYEGDKHTGFHADVKYGTHHIVPKKHEE